jgi:hypothetical protein
MYIFSLRNVIGIVAAVTMDVLSAVSVKLTGTAAVVVPQRSAYRSLLNTPWRSSMHS